MARFLTQEETDYLLKLKDSDVTKSNMIKWFAIQRKTQPMFSPQDRFKLPKDKLLNDKDEVTSVGKFIFNLFIVTPFQGKIRYINEPITKKRLEDLEAQISQLVLDEIIPCDWFIDYLNRIQWFGYVGVDFITPALSEGLIIPNEVVKKRREELIRQNKAAIEAGDAKIATAMEGELMDLAKKVLKDDPGMELYTSGAKSKLGAEYKAFCGMKGAALDNATGKYNVCVSNYMDGIDKKEYAAFGDTIVYAAYSRAVGTEKGGYITKQMFAAFQTVSLDDKGTDCHTAKTLDIVLTKSNYKLFLYRYIVEGGKLVRIDNTNIKNYIGKTVHLRSVLYCQSPKLCNKCAGDLYYNLDIKNAGLTVTKVGSVVLNLSLKNFHDTTLHTKKIDYTQYFMD